MREKQIKWGMVRRDKAVHKEKEWKDQKEYMQY
jgi:hypothetical protein